jgi:hypothetical protein
MSAQSDADGQNVKGKGYMDHLEFVSTTPGQPRARIELNGLTMASDLNKSAFGFTWARTCWS